MPQLDRIAVDIGNTFAKLHSDRGAASPWDLASPLRLPSRELAEDAWPLDRLRAWVQARQVAPGTRWIVASVHGPAEQALARWIQTERPEDSYHRLAQRDVPMRTAVLEPERLGMDRLLDAWAVNHLRTADRAAIVIDAGSAVTVDAVRADGCFLGGAILPGARMAAGALSRSTAQLPLVSPLEEGWPTVIGRSTSEAIRSGVLWGTLGAVREITTRLRDILGADAEVFVTGGDAECLRPLLGPPDGPAIQFRGHLVLSGILLLPSHPVAELTPP